MVMIFALNCYQWALLILGMYQMVYMFFFISNRNFENRLVHAYGKSLFRLKICLCYAYSLKFCLVYAYEKDLIKLEICLLRKNFTHNALFYMKKMWILSRKLLNKMGCCCDTDFNIIDHVASSELHLFYCIFDKSKGKSFAILNRKNHSQYGKIHAT